MNSGLQACAFTGEDFLGFARVSIDDMAFESGVRNFDAANVARLLRVFKTGGCDRDDPLHSIPALVRKDRLSSSSRSDLAQQLSVPPGVPLLCLHGKHRVLAAKEFYPPKDQWWSVALYNEC